MRLPYVIMFWVRRMKIMWHARSWVNFASCLVRHRVFTSTVISMDSTQEKYLEERCILVDENDVVIGSETKRTCHLNVNIETGMLHRAFSVFLFNSKSELLLQKRSNAKITFPNCWTNTCCSHPLHCTEELEEADDIGVKRAVRRKLNHELGIPQEQIPLEDLNVLTKIHYKAPSDGQWGEHEVDYMVFIQKDVTLELNSNEVAECCYANQQQLREMIQQDKDNKITLTPWFRLITNSFLFKWWDSLHDLSPHKDTRVHNLSV